ncbi:MAG TPA: hypothetical protein VN756_02155 [Solirubrobacterales bacterium]|nr:hypothetical protein [Solirubrobacterales bacterium]
MRTFVKVLAIATACLLSVAPTLAIADKPANVGNGNGPHYETPPGPDAGLPAKAKAYGHYCQGESKKHVKGQKGTPFSQCVTAMAKLANGNTTSPAKACASLSKKHVKGQKGTPYSLCVKAAAKLLG